MNTYVLYDRQDAASEQQPFYKDAFSNLHAGYAGLIALKFLVLLMTAFQIFSNLVGVLPHFGLPGGSLFVVLLL